MIAVIDAFRAELNRYLTGETVRVQASFSDVLSVDTRRGVPIVVFDNGAVGRYESGSGTDTLVFSYTVGEGDRSVESLKVLALAENDAVLTSASGEAVDVTIRRSGVQTNNEVLSLQTEMPVSVSSFSSALQTDQLPPKLLSVSADSGVYRQGDTLEFQLSFNEVVRVDVSQNAGLPTLSLSAGGEMLPVVASYAGGSGTKTLRFQYEVSANDPVANALNVASFNFNGGLVSDISGNRADVAIVPGQNALPSSVSIVIDGQNANMDMSPMSLASYSEDVVPAFIQSIAAVEGDGTYQAGDKLTFRIKLSEAVTVDASAGVPMLVLSNGAVAVYHSGSGSDELTFVYQVRASDRNADELRVLGVAENDATLLDAGGNATDVRVSQTNNLDVTSQVKISAQAPYIRTIDGIEGIYQPGDEIQLEVRFSEAVSVSDTPTLLLSNGARASYTSGTGTDTLMFSYTVGEGSAFSSADLDVSSLGLSTGGIVSVNSGNGVSTVVRPGILALSSDVVIDSTPPTGTVSIDAVALKKGESATVTLTFSEPVANPLSALEISNGTLDSLVTDETSEPGTVWKGTFRPDQDIELLTNTIVLDNSKVMDNPPADFGEGQSPSEWSFGNYGVGLSESEVFAIDTQSPVAQISSETLAGEGAVTNRLITVDFGEPVTGLTSSAITVSGGRKVPGTFTEVASGVYQLVVAPVEGAGTDTDKLSFGVSLLANAVTDAAGNSNVQLPATTFTWDEAAPEIASIASTSGSYVTGDVVAFAVTFDEVVSVSTPTDGAVPSLALSNGALAHYVSVSPDNPKTLRFEYVVASGDEATDLSVLALFENDGSIADASGNAAKVSIGSGNGLPGSTSILIDGVVPTITTMRSDDGLYLPGDEIAIEVQFSEAVHVDESEGSPVLALSNGALATYVGGSKTDVLHFTYVVVEGDYDAQDLDVLAFAEEGALVREYFGETDGQLELGDNANVAIRGEINSLAYRSEINIDSALPKIAQISANAGAYNAGDAIEIALSWSKGVSIDTTQGEPSLLLSNGALASYVPSLSSSTKLLFRYTVSENDTESGDLGIEAFRHGNARFEGLIAGGEAVLALPEQSLSAEGLLTIDLTPPEVVRFELSDTALSSGESATVTIELSEAVQQLSNSYVTVAHGVLSPFEVDESGVVWTATYTPYGDVSALDQVIRLDQGQLQDLSGNLGEGEAHSSVYQLDSAYPTVVITSDTVGVTKEPVRFVLNFSETVTGFDPLSDVVIEGGSLQAWSIETPDNSGRPEGEYSFIVTPSANSVSPIKVRVPEGVAFDEAGNGNARSQVFVQPIDTQKAHIESIEAPEGDYTYGDVVILEAKFSEPLVLSLQQDLSDHTLPELFLNNGQTARYVSGSGTDTWRFEYTIAALVNEQGDSEAIDVDPLRAISLIENDTLIQDAVGNAVQPQIGQNNGLMDAVSVDTTAPVITGFSAIEGAAYGLGEVLWIRAALSELVAIIPGLQAPTLTLSNGGTATYLTGHNSNDLLFRYVVSQGDSDSDQLAVVAFNTHDSTVEDGAGNAIDITLLAGSNDLAASHTIVVDATAPVLQGVRLVETVDPLTNTDTDASIDGYYGMGKTVAFEVDFDSDVLVDTTHGSPILTLSNGELATYVSGSGSSILRFEYTVSEAHVNTRALEVIGLAEQGALITDAASNDAIVDIDADQLNYTTLVIDTKRPTGTLAVSATEAVTSISTPVTLTLRFDEAMDVSTLSVDDLILSVSAQTEVGDGQGGSGDASLFDASGMIVPDSLTQISPTEFTVELLTPDLVRGELIIDVAQDAIRDKAGNPMTAALQTQYAVDTLTTSLSIIPVAGPFNGSQAQVALYRADGQLLTENVDYVIDPAGDATDGQVQITLLNGYRGPLLVEVNDQDTQASDYQDELTQQAKSLDTVLRTMVFIDEPAAEVAPIEIVVSPLTELATRKAGYAQGEIPTDLSTEAIGYNDKVAALFNLQGVDIARTRVTTTLDDTFDANDGLDASEAYGEALATLSAQDALTGSVRATIEQIVAGTTEQPVADSDDTALVFDTQLADAIEQSANVVDLMQDVGIDTDLTSEQALARAEALRAVIRTAAGEAPLVSTAQLQDLGVPGVTDTTLSLAQRLISQTADDGSEVDTIAKIDALLADALVALDKIITAADTNTALEVDDPITAEHYAALGFVERSALIIEAYNRALNTDGVFIDTLGSLPDLEAFIATYDNLVAYAQDPETADHVPEVTDYETLGITGTQKTDLLPIFNHILANEQQPAVLDAAVMQALVDNLRDAIDSFQRYSQDPVNEAAPTPETYQKLLLTGSEEVVASINSLLADADVLIGADVRTEMQHLIDTYNALANYVGNEAGASAPTLSDYATLGMAQLTDARAEAFLASFWPTVTSAEIADASQLDAYAEAVNALLATTDATVETVQQDPQAITTTQLALLGITVEASDLSAIRAYIADQADTAVADITALEALVDAVLSAAERITAYSQDSIAAIDTDNGGLGAPTEQDYAVVLTGTGVSVDSVASVNTALADSDITVGNTDLQTELKTVVLAYNALLDAADSLDDDDAISIQQLTEVGVDTLSADAAMNSLLLDVIEQSAAVDVANASDLQALSDAINALEATIIDGTQASLPITDTQLTLLGITGATVDNLDAIQITLAEGVADDYPTLTALQARITKTVTALDKLTQHSALDADPANNPVLQDYLDAGISGVSDTVLAQNVDGTDNLLAVNAQLRLVGDVADKNSAAEIQALVTAANDAITYVTGTVANETGTLEASTGTLSEQAQLDAYEAAGITGVSADNLLAVNAQLRLETTSTNKDSVSDIQAIVTKANDAITYLTTTIQPLTTAPAANNVGDSEVSVNDQLAAYAAAGITGVTADNLLAVNAQLRLETTSTNKDSVSDIQTIVTKANTALALIEEYNNGDGTTVLTKTTATNKTVLTKADYEAVGVTGVSDQAVASGVEGTDNLAAVNAQVLLSNPGEANSVAKIQGLVSFGTQAIAYVTTAIQPLTTAPAANNVGENEVSVDDQLAAYAAAGITGVSADNLLAVNALLRLETTATNKDSVSDIEAIVTKADTALAKIENHQAGDAPLEIADYESVGVLSVSEDNRLAVNAQIVRASNGEADSVLDIEARVTSANLALAKVVSDIAPLTSTADPDAATQIEAYNAAGIIEVTEENLLAVNAQIRKQLEADNLLLDNLNSVAELQSKVSAANTAIAYLTTTIQLLTTAPADGAEGEGEVSVDDQLAAYAEAGITGVSADNLLAVNAQLRLETTSTNKDSVSDIQAIVTKANAALAKIENHQAGDAPLEIADYESVGVLSVSEDNRLAVNAQIVRALDEEADSVLDIEARVTSANLALAKVVSDIAPLTSTADPDAATQIEAYNAAGIIEVTEENLLAVNAQIRKQLEADSSALDNLNSVAELQSKVSAANTAIAYLTTTIQPLTTAPAANNVGDSEVSVNDQLAAYAAAGITGVSADNLLAVNAQLRLETTATDKDSVSDIQAIVTKANTALALIEEYNNGDGTTVLANSNTTLTIPDYEAAGIVGVDANNLFSVNRLMLAASTDGADTVGEIQSIAAAGIQAHQDALAKISAFADTLATSTETVAGDTDDKEVLTLTLPSLTAQAGYTLKVGNVIVESGALDADPTPAELVTALQSDSAYTLSPFTVALHQTNTNELVITFKNVGERTAVAELRSEMPVVVDYENAGATGADAENLYAINDGLMTRTSTQADSTTEVQSLVTASEVVHTNALTQVLNYAAGTNTTKPSVKTYKLAGLTAVTESNLTAVNKIVEAEDSSTINDYATAASFVNAGVQAYEAALLTLADYANEVGGAATPDLTDYETAGITGLQAGDIDMINALMIQREAADDGIATTTTGIQSIVNKGLAAIFKIRDAAQNNAAGNNTDPADDLTATDYEAVGVPTTDLVNVGALNDALDSVAVTGADVRAYADLMDVVNAVKAVDALADGTDDNGTATGAVDLTAADFAAMGVTGLDTTTTPESDEQVARLAILNDVLDRKDNSTAYPGGNADTVAEVQALHDAAQALLRTAQGETPKITEVQLELLGFTTLTASDITANNLSAIQQVLINTYTANSDFTGINTLAKVETLTKNAVDALEAIKANAAANNSATDTTNTGLDLNGASTGLDAADFAAMGVSTVTDSGTGSANNQAMVLSVLDSTAITAAEVTTYEQVQAIVDSVNTILIYVENGTDAPKLSDFTTLGLANITTADQLTLINSYLNATATLVTDIDSFARLQARVTAVNHFLLDAAITDRAGIDAAITASDSYVTTSADLEALGFTYVNTSTTAATLVNAGQATTEVTPENIASVRLAIANSANDLSELQSFSALKTLIEDTAKAANTIQAYGAGVSGAPVPTVADYAAIGVTGVNSLNVAAINSSLAEAGVLDTITSSVAAEAQDIVNTWEKVQALADGETDTVAINTTVADIIPALARVNNSDASGSGFTASASHVYGVEGLDLNNAFDNDPNTLFATQTSLDSATTNVVITIAAPKLYEVQGYRITANNASLQWTALRLEGWDGSSWSVLDTQTASAGRTAGAEEFQIDQPFGAYNQYRFVITDWEGVNMDIHEIELFAANTSYTVYTSDTDSDGFVGKDSDIVLLTSTEYASIGIKSRDGSSDLSARATELLNQLIDERGLNAVDNTAEIKALAVAIEALLETAAITDGTATATNGDITQAQLNLLGLSLIDGNNVGGIITYLKGSGGDGSSSNPDYSQTLHIAEIRADLVSAITGLSELEKAAELNNATSSYPLAAHWDVINSLTSGDTTDEVASDDVDSFNSMLNTQTIDGLVTKNATDTNGLLSRIADYNAVLTAADGTLGAGATLTLTADEYARIGITGLEATSGESATQTTKLALLNEVIEGSAKTAVDTIPKLQLVFNATDALLRTIDGETPAISKAQLELLGFTGVTADNLSAIQKALSDVDTATDYAAVDSLSEVTAIVNDAISALAAISDAALGNDADSRTDGVDTTAGLTADDFVAMGVEGVDATNLSLILSALNDTDIDNTDIFNLETTQALVTAAAKVVALAGNATAPKLVAADLTKLGLDLSELDSGNVKANAIALLNDLLIADSTAQTAVADIQVLVDALAALIDDIAQADAANLSMTDAEFEDLGFNATSPALLNGASTAASSDITTHNIQAIRVALSATADDLSDVASLSDLQTLVNDTAQSANKIAHYAEAATLPTLAALIPTVEDFAAIGVSGVDSTNLSAILDAVADLSAIDNEIAGQVQTLVDAYAPFITVADGEDNDQDLIVDQDYIDLGITLSTDADIKAAQLSVLTDVFDIKSYEEIDTITELQAIADAVKSILDTAKLDVATADFDNNGVSIAELELLGIARVTNDNLASVRWILANEATTEGDLDTLNSLSEIQALIANVVNAIDVITAYAADNSNPAPSVQAYTFAGVTGVTEDNLEAVNREVDASERSDVDTVTKLATVVDRGLEAHLAVVNKIADYSQALVSASVVEGGDSTIASDGSRTSATPAQQSMLLTGLTFASDQVLSLRVGGMTLASDPLAGTAATDLLAALKASANYTDAPFTLSLNGDSSALLIDWKAWGEVADTAILRTEQPSADDYVLAGLNIATRTNEGVVEENLYAVNAAVEAASLTATANDATVAAVKTLLDSVQTVVTGGISANTTALAKIETFADDTGTSAAAPTVADYALANIDGVTEANLIAVNARLKVLNSTPSSALTTEDIEAAVADADARLARFENNTPVAPKTAFTKADYEAIGLSGISDTAVDVTNSIDGTDNLLAVNAQVALASAGDVNSILDLQWAIARADAAIDYLLTAVAVEIGTSDASTGTLSELAQLKAYSAAGITGVSAANLLAVNAQLRLEASTTAKNSVSEIQSIVTKANAALAYIHSDVAVETGTSDATTGTLSEQAQLDAYAAIGVTGVTADNLLAMNAQLRLETTSENKDSVADIQAIVTKANAAIALIEEYNNGDGSTTLANNATTLTVANYEAAGVTGVNDTALDQANSIDGTDNLAAVNAQVLLASATDADTVAKIQALVTAGNDAISYLSTDIQPLITAPAEGTQTSGELSMEVQLAAYEAAGISGVSADNLLAVNAQLRLETDTALKNSVSEIEVIVGKANDALAYINSDVAVEIGTSDAGTGTLSEQAQLEAYLAAGIRGVTTKNLLAVNAQLRLESDADNKDSVADIQTMVSQADAAITIVESFNNGALGRELTTADYENIGAIGVTDITLYAVNSEMASDSTALLDNLGDIQALVDSGVGLQASALASLQANGSGTINEYLLAGVNDISDRLLDSVNYLVGRDSLTTLSDFQAAVDMLLADVTAPDALTVALADDTGVSDSDAITSATTLEFDGKEDGSKLEYSLDSGTSWSVFSGLTTDIPVTAGGITTAVAPNIEVTGFAKADLSATDPIRGLTESPLVLFMDVVVPASNATETVVRHLFEVGGESTGMSLYARGEDLIFHIGDDASGAETPIMATDALVAGRQNYIMVEVLENTAPGLTNTVNIYVNHSEGSPIDDLNLVATAAIDRDFLIGGDGIGWGQVGGEQSQGQGDNEESFNGEIINGRIWLDQTKESVWTVGNTSGTVLVRETDLAGNVGAPVALAYTYDNLAPLIHSVALKNDTGSDPSDSISNDGTLSIDASDYVSYRYSTNGQLSWVDGTGTEFDLSEGNYFDGQVAVELTDAAGNISTQTLGAFEVDESISQATTMLTLDYNKENEYFRLANGGIDTDASAVNSEATLRGGINRFDLDVDGRGLTRTDWGDRATGITFLRDSGATTYRTTTPTNGTDDDFYIDFTMPDTLSTTTNNVLFEAGGSGNGTNVYHTGSTLNISIGTDNDLDFSKSNALEAGKRYQLILRVDKNNYAVWLGERTDSGHAIEMELIKAWGAHDGTSWSGGDGWGVGRVFSSVQGENSPLNLTFSNFEGTIHEWLFYNDIDAGINFSTAGDTAFTTATDIAGNTAVSNNIDFITADNTYNLNGQTINVGAGAMILAPDTVNSHPALAKTHGDFPTRLLIDNLSADEWEYSLDSGTTWQQGEGDSLLLPDGHYLQESIQIRVDGAAPRALNFQEVMVDYAYSESDYASVIAAYANQTSTFTPDLDTYKLAGFDNLLLAEKEFITPYIANAGFSASSPVSDVNALVIAGEQLYDKFSQYILSNGSTDAPTLSDYNSLGLGDRVSAFNLDAINAVMRGETSPFARFDDFVSTIDTAVAEYEALLDHVRSFNEYGVDTSTEFKFIPDMDDGSNDDVDRAGLTVSSEYQPAGHSGYFDWELFDRNTSTLYATADGSLPHYLGWKDTTGQYAMGALSKVYWDNRDNTNYKGRIPGDFTIEGWNGSSWETIDTVTNFDEVGNPTFSMSETLENRFSTYSGFQLVVTDTWGSEGQVNLWELEFWANPVLELTAAQWNMLGVSGATESNVDALNAFVRDSGMCDLGDNLGSVISQVEPLFGISEILRGGSTAFSADQIRSINKSLFVLTDFIASDSDNYLPVDLFDGEVADVAELYSVLDAADEVSQTKFADYLLALDAFESFISTDEVSFVPVLTSNDDPGFEFSSERIDGGREYYGWKAFDGTSQHWSSGSMEGIGSFVGWKDSSLLPSYLTSFKIQARSGSNIEQSVKDFTIQGWDQDTNAWVDIQSFTDTSWSSLSQEQEFFIDEANQDKSFTGFRIYIEDVQSGADASIGELTFIVSNATEPLDLHTLQALGFEAQDDADAYAISAELATQFKGNQTADLLSTLQDARVATSRTLDSISDFGSVSDYEAQSDVSLSNIELNGLLGVDLLEAEDMSNAIEHLINASSAPSTRDNLDNLVLADAYIGGITHSVGGEELLYKGQVVSDTTPSLDIVLNDVDVGDELILVIDDQEISLGTLEQEEIDNGHVYLTDVNLAEYDRDSDGVTLSVRVQHTDETVSVSTDIDYLY